jgi:hypothetical protein
MPQKKKNQKRFGLGWGVAQDVKHILHKHKALNLNPSTTKKR